METLIDQTPLLQTSQSTEQVMHSDLVIRPVQPIMFG